MGEDKNFFTLDYAGTIGLMAFVIGLMNWAENRQQSAQSDQLIKQIDVDAANDRQAHILLDELGKKFDEQNEMLRKILEVIK